MEIEGEAAGGGAEFADAAGASGAFALIATLEDGEPGDERACAEPLSFLNDSGDITFASEARQCVERVDAIFGGVTTGQTDSLASDV